ncbi:MAG: single-stranded-DNA-specific exonuclease RecJ [Proteobacteria bacterium]|nr:single-stranded-DNA-specific exonuclease RecJ [Pseudomonadota bacterium]
MIKDLPRPKIKQRTVDTKRENQSLEEGVSALIARIIASRPFLEDVSPKELLSPKLKSLDSPQQLADIEKAVSRIIQALENNEVIGIETDHDCDGQTSHAVLVVALTEYFGHSPSRLKSYIGHRLKEGYGLSRSVVNRILEDSPRPTLIITADNGSSDEDQIAELKKVGIDVIVTDHHEIPASGIPKSALAVLNPTREDCHYPDRYIAGCMVAWLLMAATRQALVARGKEIPSLAPCLDFVAVGTIADCVSIARSRNNRAVVAYGMKLIQQGLRPCWRAILSQLSLPLSSEDLGFKIGPLLNSDGRLSCAFGSVSYLLSENDEQAAQWITHLQEQNAQRKSIQDNITQLALVEGLKQYQQGKRGLCIFLEDGHAGVHGISASRLKDLFGRPIIIFCAKDNEPLLLTGSARSVEGVHLKQVLQKVATQDPTVMERFGGHQGAAGLTIQRAKFDKFAQLFETVLQEDYPEALFGPVIWTDGKFNLDDLTINFAEELVSKLEPFGREFEFPTFELSGKIVSLDLLGQTKTHARVGLAVEDLWFEAVWFNCKRANEPLSVRVGDKVKVVFAPKLQTFRGQRKLNCQIVHLELEE